MIIDSIIEKRSKNKRDYGLDINLRRQQRKKKERNCLIGHRAVERTRRKGSEKASAKEESRGLLRRGRKCCKWSKMWAESDSGGGGGGVALLTMVGCEIGVGDAAAKGRSRRCSREDISRRKDVYRCRCFSFFLATFRMRGKGFTASQDARV